MNALTLAPPPPPTITVRRNGPADPCWVRDRWLVPQEEAKALSQPITRRLLVDGVGHYLDRGHGHTVVLPAGAPETRVFVCVKGSGWLEFGGARHRVEAGDALLIPAGLPHSYGATEFPWSIWWCTLLGTDAADLVQNAALGAGHPIIPIQDAPRLVSVIDEIATIYESEASESQILEATSTAWKLMARIGADRSRFAATDPLQRAKDYLAVHLDEPVSISALASHVGVSHARLNRLFQSTLGTGARGYHIDLRMAKARRLLAATDASIADIARETGYADPYYFSRHFRQVNGVSPSRYRDGVRRP